MNLKRFFHGFDSHPTPPAAEPVQKAQGTPVAVAWLILSNEPADLEKKIFINDMFFEVKNNMSVKASTHKLWLVLSQNGFFLHPELEKQYMKQRTCFFDGGEIVTHKADEGNFEETCSECGYIYNEK